MKKWKNMECAGSPALCLAKLASLVTGRGRRVWVIPALLFMAFVAQSEVTVTNVAVAQRPGTKLVDIYYDVSDSDGDAVAVFVNIKNGATVVNAPNLSGELGTGLPTGTNKHIVWDAGADWDGKAATLTYTVTADDGTLSMVSIPGGTNSGIDPDFRKYSLTVGAFEMDETEITKTQWDMVCSWAATNDYSFSHSGSGKAPNHPVHSVNWYDCVKWCNARSEMDGRTPCYTVGGSTYKTGESSPDCNFGADGYRLPTNEEWEYAARGGLVGKRFPWGDTINHSHANYKANGSAFPYDDSGYSDYTYHLTYDYGAHPYTAPAGSFSANGYGLYDMAGNVWEWCNTATGAYRSLRGGCWYYLASDARCGISPWNDPARAGDSLGFRAIRR